MTEPADKCIGYTKSGLRIIGTTPEGWDIVDFDDLLDYMDVDDPELDNWISSLSEEEFLEVASAVEHNFLRKYKYGCVKKVEYE